MSSSNTETRNRLLFIVFFVLRQILLTLPSLHSKKSSTNSFFILYHSGSSRFYLITVSPFRLFHSYSKTTYSQYHINPSNKILNSHRKQTVCYPVPHLLSYKTSNNNVLLHHHLTQPPMHHHRYVHLQRRQRQNHRHHASSWNTRLPRTSSLYNRRRPTSKSQRHNA